MATPVFFIDIGPDGSTAVHPRRLELPFLVAPIPAPTKGKNFNLIREPLITIGCMHLPHHHFEFDSSFVGPDSESRFTKFSKLMKLLQAQDPEKRMPPISVFGHADPTGRDEYNGPLSGRRALAVYGILTRNVKLWGKLHDTPFSGDTWGNKVIRRILSTGLRVDGAIEPPFFTGPIDGETPAEKQQIEKDTQEAIKAYKSARGIKPENGVLDKETRKQLFLEYMNTICHDEAGDPFILNEETDFVCRNKDSKTHKGDVQGCGEFNPIFLLSKAEEDLFNSKKEFKEARDQMYARDRRVVVFIFKHGTELTPEKWPCPIAAITGGEYNQKACEKRFWSDGMKHRRVAGDDQRTFGKDMDLAVFDADGNVTTDDEGFVQFRKVEETGNTMACRFYHGFAVHSPCEAGLKEWIVRFRIDGIVAANEPAKPVPLANRRYVLSMGEEKFSATVRGTLDAKGELRIPVLDPRVKMTVKLDAWGALFEFKEDEKETQPGDLVDGKFPDEDKFLPIVLDGGELKMVGTDEDVDDIASRQRLYNLGFGPGNPAKWDREKDQVPAARAYRESRKLPDGASLRDELRKEHELEDAAPPPDPEDDASGDEAGIQ
jgi:hypothetical protein